MLHLKFLSQPQQTDIHI